MSNFDDHNQRWDDRRSSINASDPAYGGLSLSEVISTPWLAKAYGLALSEDNDIENLSSDQNAADIDFRKIWWFVSVQVIAVAVILYFTYAY